MIKNWLSDISTIRPFRLIFALLLSGLISLSVFAQDTLAVEASAGAAPATASDGIPTDAAIISSGKSLFENNCQQCHAINDVVVGPALKDVQNRWKLNNLISFIKYPQKYIETGDKYAVGLYEKYKQYMPNHDFLSDAEVLSILAWVKDEGNKVPVQEVVSGSADTGAAATKKSGPSSEMLSLILGILVVVLLLFLIVLILLIGVITRFIKTKEGLSEEEAELVNQKFDLAVFFRSGFFKGSVTVIVLLFFFKVAFDAVMNVGMQQGYAPKQPIAFSHKLHAGEYQIDCNYCHTGVKKGKSAVIPAANVCMNCHNAIKPESPEIQKIYAALENDKPIEWVRVHNLPDLAYFNHAQHVAVAGLECQNCHGPIEQMEVVQQYSPLTMGWCINCHRETAVNAKDNEYYTKMVELHNGATKEPMKVKDIGGLECSKCHY